MGEGWGARDCGWGPWRGGGTCQVSSRKERARAHVTSPQSLMLSEPDALRVLPPAQTTTHLPTSRPLLEKPSLCTALKTPRIPGTSAQD